MIAAVGKGEVRVETKGVCTGDGGRGDGVLHALARSAVKIKLIKRRFIVFFSLPQTSNAVSKVYRLGCPDPY